MKFGGFPVKEFGPIFKLNLNTDEKSIFPSKEEEKNKPINFLKTRSKNLYLVGLQSGITYFNTLTGEYIPFEQYNEFEELKYATVYYLHSNQAGIWISTNQGIFLADEQKGVVQRFSQQSGDLPVNCIVHLHENTATPDEDDFWFSNLQ